MENDKIKKEIFNPEEENHKKLEQLFPGVIKDGALDISALLDELGEYEVVEKEKYELTWAGKSKAKQIANTDIAGRTLHYIPADSKDPDTTENLYIEGDNLEVLKLLRSSYYGQIKMIYIDPPYNTGNDFVYKDNFSISKEQSDKDEGETDEEGTRYIINQKSSNRYHANWLNMMYPRLKVAKDLLRDDGVIFVSIDENEVCNLRKLCDEVFGEENNAGEIVWKNSSKNDQAYISIQHEYIVSYCKNKQFNSGVWQEKKEGLDDIYKAFEGFKRKHGNNWEEIHIEALKWYKQFSESNPIFSHKHYSWMDKNGVYFPDNISGPNFGQYRYDVIHPITGKVCKEPASGWRYPEGTMLQRIKDELVHFGKDETTIPCNKTYLKNTEYQSLTSIKYKDGRVASNLLNSLMGGNYFTNPKDLDLMNLMAKAISVKNDDIVLDFFSGSATTAHSILQLNAEDGGNRKFIMVQLPEICDEKSEAYKAGYKNICEIGKERIRRAGEKIKKELIEKQSGKLQLEGESFDPENQDIGFKVFRVGDTNIRWNKENFDQQRSLEESAYSDKDHLDFMAGFKDIDVVYEIILHHRDIPLSSKVDLLNDIGTRTYIFADTVVVCLEEKITNEIVDKIASIDPKPQKIIFRDSAFDDDISLKLNTLTRFDIQLKKNNQTKDQTYRVEFI